MRAAETGRLQFERALVGRARDTLIADGFESTFVLPAIGFMRSVCHAARTEDQGNVPARSRAFGNAAGSRDMRAEWQQSRMVVTLSVFSVSAHCNLLSSSASSPRNAPSRSSMSVGHKYWSHLGSEGSCAAAGFLNRAP